MFAWFLLKRTYGFEEAIARRIPRWLFNAWPSLISEWNDLSNSGSPFCLSFCSRGYMVWKKILFKVLKTAAMVAQHNDSAGCETRIPSLMPYKLKLVHSSIAIILMGKRELIALLNLSSWCLLMVERLFLAVPRGCLQFVIVVLPDHTHYFLATALYKYADGFLDLNS